MSTDGSEATLVLNKTMLRLGKRPYGCTKLYQFVLGRHVVVETDNKPLQTSTNSYTEHTTIAKYLAKY